jgi:hypothetical protein
MGLYFRLKSYRMEGLPHQMGYRFRELEDLPFLTL